MTTNVSKVFLLEVASGRAVEAELRDAIEDAQLIDWQTKWQPALIAVLQELHRRGVPLADWPQSKHWNWRDKIAQVKGLLAYRGFCVTCDGVTQGLMRVDLNRTAREPSQKGKPLGYIDYLEVASWNRSDLGQQIQYKGIGTALMVAAIDLSEHEGFKGRIGLHSLPQSDSFYRDRCGMAELGPDSSCQNLTYFEMTREQAKKYLDEEQ